MSKDSSSSLPMVSIGLPVYNGEQYVRDAIDGVLRQTFNDFELVISDNASTDSTQNICLEFAEADSRVRYEYSDKNIGAAPNFNRCFALARSTKYFKWITYDDLMTDDFLERCIDALEGDVDASLAFPEIVHADAGGNVTSRQSPNDLSLVDPEPGHRARRLLEYGLDGPDIYWTIYGVIRRAALERTDLHGRYIASDQVLLFQLALTGKFLQVGDARFIHRAHPDAWTMTTGRTPKSDAVWFGGRARSGVVLPHWTLLVRHIRSLWRRGLSFSDKTQCLRAIAHRAVREWRNLGGDIKIAVRDLISRRRVRS